MQAGGQFLLRQRVHSIRVAFQDEVGTPGRRAVLEFSLVLADEVLSSLDGIVDGEMCQVEEEGPVAIGLQEADRLASVALGEGALVEAIALYALVIALVILFG